MAVPQINTELPHNPEILCLGIQYTFKRIKNKNTVYTAVLIAAFFTIARS